MEGLYVLVLLFVVALIAAPVMAIMALARVRELGSRPGFGPELLQRIYALEQKLAALEQQLRTVLHRLTQLERGPAGAHETPLPTQAPTARPAETTPTISPREAAPAGQPPPPVRTPPAPPAFRAAMASPSGKAPASGIDLETRIAGRWLNRVGILAVIFAVAFFLKYAFENNWIGPAGRVAIGLLLGAAQLPWSHWLLGRGYKYFSEGIAGLGAAVMYLSLWAGWHYYQLFSQDVAFAGMVAVTAAMIGVAVGRDSQRIALLALAGGLLTPILVSTGKDQQVVLFTYLAILSSGILLLAWVRNWTYLAPVAFFATEIYFWGWYESFYRESKVLRTSLFATLFFVIFASLPVIRSRRESRLGAAEMSVVLANALAYLAALQALLYDHYRWGLTLAVLALAAAHLLVVQGLPKPREGGQPLVKLLFAGLALLFVTLVIPIRLEGKWITMAWAVEGAILVWSGLRAKTWQLRASGLTLIGVAAARLLFLPIPAERFLLNARFGAYTAVVASLAAVMYFASRTGEELSDGENAIWPVLGIACNGFALAALSLEAWDLFGRMESLQLSRGLAQQLALSVVWTIYATGLLLAGMKRGVAGLRWQALALYGLVVGKVFLFDLSSLERFYRIVSFLVLGVVLLAVSFFYQRRLAASDEEKR